MRRWANVTKRKKPLCIPLTRSQSPPSLSLSLARANVHFCCAQAMCGIQSMHIKYNSLSICQSRVDVCIVDVIKLSMCDIYEATRNQHVANVTFHGDLFRWLRIHAPLINTAIRYIKSIFGFCQQFLFSGANSKNFHFR